MREAIYFVLCCIFWKLFSNSNLAVGKVIRSNENIRITHSSEFANDLQHLAIDRFSGKVSNSSNVWHYCLLSMWLCGFIVFVDKIFIGGRNKLYELTADLNVIAETNTGPRNEYIDCSFHECAIGATQIPVDNINKVLLIDYDSNRLITCGSFHGSCSTRLLSDINYEQDAIEWVVADSESKFSLNCT